MFELVENLTKDGTKERLNYSRFYGEINHENMEVKYKHAIDETERY